MQEAAPVAAAAPVVPIDEEAVRIEKKIAEYKINVLSAGMVVVFVFVAAIVISWAPIFFQYGGCDMNSESLGEGMQSSFSGRLFDTINNFICTDSRYRFFEYAVCLRPVAIVLLSVYIFIAMIRLFCGEGANISRIYTKVNTDTFHIVVGIILLNTIFNVFLLRDIFLIHLFKLPIVYHEFWIDFAFYEFITIIGCFVLNVVILGFFSCVSMIADFANYKTK